MSEEIKKVEGEPEGDAKIGNVKISNDVIATVAGIATGEVAGVAGMGGSVVGGIAEILGGKRNRGKGVKVELDGDNVIIDLYIIVDYGVRIPDVSWEVQENVKNSVESMTGMTVEKVNIHIEGVSFEREREREAEEELAKKIEAPEEIAETDE